MTQQDGAPVDGPGAHPPSAYTPYGALPDDAPSYGQAPYGEAPYGQAPYGQAPYGQVPYGQAPYGQAPYGQVPYGQAPYPAPYGYPPVVVQRTNGMAVASLVLGILWLYWLGSVLALVFGYVAKRQILERGEGGSGLATAGIVLGWIGVGVLALGVVLGAAAFSTG